MGKRSDGDPDNPAGEQSGQDDPAAGEPPKRPSQLDLGGAQLTYPDDGRLSRVVRLIDTWIGRIEQVVLVAILAIVVLTAAGHALLDRLVEVRIESKDQIIRAGTFAIAMLGAAFASHQSRHLSMDLVSRRISPRARLILKVILAQFTIAIVAVLGRSALHLIEREKSEDHLLSTEHIAWLIPIGCGLIILHNLLHTVIDLDYLARGKTPPERMRSAH